MELNLRTVMMHGLQQLREQFPGIPQIRHEGITGNYGIRREETDVKTNCDSCMYFEYDEEYEEYFCSVNMDEDEMVRFMEDRHYSCPYYRYGDEYAIVRKQM